MYREVDILLNQYRTESDDEEIVFDCEEVPRPNQYKEEDALSSTIPFVLRVKFMVLFDVPSE